LIRIFFIVMRSGNTISTSPPLTIGAYNKNFNSFHSH
jgi:hypothetical protein